MKIKWGAITAVVTCVILSITAVIGVNNYFAKAEEVEKNDSVIKEEMERNDQLIIERLDISIADQQIYQHEQKIQRFEDLERTNHELTPIEQDIKEEIGEELQEIKKRRDESYKRYNELKK